MDTADYLNDVLMICSALGSSLVGAFCGWQLRTAKFKHSASPASQSGAELQTGLGDTNEASRESGVPYEFDSLTPRASLFDDEKGDFLDTARPLLELPESSTGMSPQEMQQAALRLMQLVERLSSHVNVHDAELTEVSASLTKEKSVPTIDLVLSAVHRLTIANETMQRQLRESRNQINDQALRIQTAEEHANTDALTRIANRRAFDLAIHQWNGSTPGALVLLDIDHFKKFNDNHGHRAGDEVLRTVASLLHEQLSQRCLVARYGGEEFALVFDDDRLEDVLPLVDAARLKIAENMTRFEDKVLSVTCSMGATRMIAGEPSVQWIQRADDALYHAKDAGRNCGYCIECQTIGNPETPFRIGSLRAGDETRSVIDYVKRSDDPLSRRVVNHALLERIPNVEVLGQSYRELLQRLGKAPVCLSVVAIGITGPAMSMDTPGNDSGDTRLTRLLDVLQRFCRPVDRIGHFDEQTLIVSMPGLDDSELDQQVNVLSDVLVAQLQIPSSDLQIGRASIDVSDTFQSLVQRAVVAVQV